MNTSPAPSPTLDRWEAHLRALAATGHSGPPQGAPAAFGLWVGNRRTSAAPADTTRDDALWWALLDDRLDPCSCVDIEASGPLFEQGSSRTIEVWTERELSGLHALERLALRRGRPDLAARARAGALWHVEHTQPDNATNRPWGASLFLVIAHESEDLAARLYAETLIHNCQTTHGVPDALSAHILRDAADALAEYQRNAAP